MKERTTRKNVMQSHDVVVNVSYGALQFLLKYENEQFYTARIEGWGANIYSFGSIAIVTGYAPFGNVSPSWDVTNSYEKRAIAIDSSNMNYEKKRIETKKLLNEFLADMKNLR